MTAQLGFAFLNPLPSSTFDHAGDALTVVDLCCGCGMASLGLSETGAFDILAGIDTWYDATEAFCLNHGNDYDMFRDAGWGGVEDALANQDRDFRVDVVLTGPPCQDDSLANHGADKGRGAIKAPALETAKALGATWIIMEMVSSQYVGWCREQGARQVLQLQDCKLGGFTVRKRWFAIWGPRDLEIEESAPRGWGEALGIDDPDARLATEGDNLSKRWRRAKAPHEPAHACVGGDRRHVLRLGDGREFRLGPVEESALSGFPNLQLRNAEHMCEQDGREWIWAYGAKNERAANTMIGNGWPQAFGRAIGQALVRSTEETKC